MVMLPSPYKVNPYFPHSDSKVETDRQGSAMALRVPKTRKKD